MTIKAPNQKKRKTYTTHYPYKVAYHTGVIYSGLQSLYEYLSSSEVKDTRSAKKVREIIRYMEQEIISDFYETKEKPKSLLKL